LYFESISLFVVFVFVFVLFFVPFPSACCRRKPHGKEHATLRNPKGNRGEGSKRSSFRCDFLARAALGLQPHSCFYREAPTCSSDSEAPVSSGNVPMIDPRAFNVVAQPRLWGSIQGDTPWREILVLLI
jgi:hypothetical protein